MELVFLQNSATQPRCHKRYRFFRDIGVKGKVYSFSRNWYNVNLPKDIEIINLGDLAPGSYLKRLLLYIRKLRVVFNENKGSVFYCYGQDMAFVAFLFRRRFIYEESDIMYLEYRNSLMRWMMKKLDLFLQKKSVCTVFTSQGFVNYLYKEKPDNVFVLPNKLDGYFIEKERPSSKQFDINALKFAFIGLIRYEENMFPFIEVMIENNPNHEFHIWGDGGEDHKKLISDFCKNHSQVHYHGPFRNPFDLDDIYSNVDINFVCYNAEGRNEQIAEPNKLYESTFFKTPMMVSPHTYLSEVVKKRGNGFVVDCSNKDTIQSFFDSLSKDELLKKVHACELINQTELVDNIEDYKSIVRFANKAIN